jgi:hypothetical protein
MTRQAVIGVVIPQHCLSPVRHVLMAKWTGTHSFNDSGLERPADTKRNFHRRSVTVVLVGALGTFFANRPVGHKRCPRAEPVLKVPLKRLFS